MLTNWKTEMPTAAVTYKCLLQLLLILMWRLTVSSLNHCPSQYTMIFFFTEQMTHTVLILQGEAWFLCLHLQTHISSPMLKTVVICSFHQNQWKLRCQAFVRINLSCAIELEVAVRDTFSPQHPNYFHLKWVAPFPYSLTEEVVKDWSTEGADSLCRAGKPLEFMCNNGMQ